MQRSAYKYLYILYIVYNKLVKKLVYLKPLIKYVLVCYLPAFVARIFWLNSQFPLYSEYCLLVSSNHSLIFQSLCSHFQGSPNIIMACAFVCLPCWVENS